MNDRPVRVRFAPSPTGPLHIGGVRTALYNYLFARKHKGKFIIRIEDTDRSRYVPGAEEYIFESLAWLGLVPDESPLKGGPFAPYRQSERKEIYRDFVLRLVEQGSAYYAFDTPEELEQARKSFSDSHDQFLYNISTRRRMKNSLSLTREETEQKLSEGVPFVIRLKIPENEEIRLKDEIRGWVEVNSSALDDKVLLKSDGMPTYHLAHVVDDHLMKITHVIRGEEWLPSAPAHVLLYKYLGWIDHMPHFAHLPLLLKPEGTGKLSKRDADKGGFPIFPISWKDPHTGELTRGFREYGYLPEAIVNFLAMLGWNPGTEQEMFTMDELIEKFTIERVNKSGAKFDIEKARYFNQQYIRGKSAKEFTGPVIEQFRKHNIDADPEKLAWIINEMKERVSFPDEFFIKTQYFFRKPEIVDLTKVRKHYRTETAKAFRELILHLEKTGTGLSDDQFREMISGVMEKNGIRPGQVMLMIRVMVTGSVTGIDLMKTLEIIGPVEVAERLRSGMALMEK